GLSGNTIGDEDFQPQLAERWEWDAPTTPVFHLDPRARWQDGHAVTAADVAFTYDAYTDSLVNSSARSSLRHIAAVTTRDSLTVVFRFRERYPEMFYDAVYHMRILPAHLLRPAPRDHWKTGPFGGGHVGDGSYRFVRWQPARSGELVADSSVFLGRAAIRRLIWRSTLGELGKVPPAPMSSLLWIWDPEIRRLPFDTAQAASILNANGWRDHDGDGIRDRAGQPLAFHILVPTTSVLRKQYARLLQE